jgi:hypothetical protein
MKTSPKTSVALLAILALGGSTAGSLFSDSLQTNVIGTIGSAGTFFPDREFQVPAQQAAFIPDDVKSDVEDDVIALPIEATTLTPVLVAETEIRAITSPEVVAPPISSVEPAHTPSPANTPEAVVSPSPEPSPEVSATQIPEPEPAPSESISIPE